MEFGSFWTELFISDSSFFLKFSGSTMTLCKYLPHFWGEVCFCLVEITSRFVLLELFGIHLTHINQARDEIHALPTLKTKLKHQDF